MVVIHHKSSNPAYLYSLSKAFNIVLCSAKEVKSEGNAIVPLPHFFRVLNIFVSILSILFSTFICRKYSSFLRQKVKDEQFF